MAREFIGMWSLKTLCYSDLQMKEMDVVLKEEGGIHRHK